jgi:integrase
MTSTIGQIEWLSIILDFHDQRHTFPARLAQAVVALSQMQEFLGHEPPMITQHHYVHHQPESCRGGAKELDRLRREKSTALAQLRES